MNFWKKEVVTELPGELSGSPYDVVVFGGGYAGFAAARQVSATGKRVLLWEPQGGVLWESGRAFHAYTGAWTPEFTPFAQAVALVTGVSTEQLDAAAAESVALDLLRKSNVALLFDAMPFAVGCKDGMLVAVDVATKRGLRRLRARQWIDASEAGTLVRLLDTNWHPRQPVATTAYVHWQRFRWPDAKAVKLDGDAEWLPSYWNCERIVKIPLSANAQHFLSEIPPVLSNLRSVCGDGLKEAFVSHTSFVPYPEYASGQASLAAPVANLVMAIPGGTASAVRTLVDRFELGLNAARDVIDAACADAGVEVGAIRPGPPVSHIEADVVVAGLGTGGVMAAVAAAREGARVAAFDRSGLAGGVGVGAGISSYYYGYQGGLQDEVDERVRDMMNLFSPEGACVGAFHADAKRVVLDAMLREAGVDVHLGCMLASTHRVGARIESVLLASHDGLQSWKAQNWVDATGDGDLCALAGSRYRLGRVHDGKLHAFTQSCGAFSLRDARLKPYLTNPDSGFVDSTDCVATTQARQHGVAALTMPIMNSLNRRTHFSPFLGIRQGRTIEADYSLTLDDLVERRTFPDCIGCTGSHYDNHARDYENESMDALFYVWIAGLWKLPTACEIPYRMLLPRGLDNVWIGCRAAGATEEAISSFRMQRDIQRIGEAAGYAAALACATGTTSRALDLTTLFQRLEASGALPPPEDGPQDFGRSRKVADWVPFPELTGGVAACVELALSGTDLVETGLALWRTYRQRAEGAEALLRQALHSSDDLAAWRSAAILGAWGDAAGLECLRQVAESGDARPNAIAGAPLADFTRASVAGHIVAWHERKG